MQLEESKAKYIWYEGEINMSKSWFLIKYSRDWLRIGEQRHEHREAWYETEYNKVTGKWSKAQRILCQFQEEETMSGWQKFWGGGEIRAGP